MTLELQLEHGLMLIDYSDASLLNLSTIKSRKIRNKYYAYSTRDAKFVHRVLMKASTGQIVDHKNGNGLDNRKENLRFVNCSQNTVNSEVYKSCKGVYQCKSGKWHARIKDGPYRRNLGTFSTREEAITVYKIAQDSLIKKYEG